MDKIMIKPRDTVYLCGPISGLPNFNYPAFNAAEKLIRERYGCRVLNPARQPDGLTWEEYMRRGCADVVSATILIVLPGWRKSKGAQEEMACAAIHGIRVVMWEELIMKVFICDECWEGAYVVKAESKEEAIAKISEFAGLDIDGSAIKEVTKHIYEMNEGVIRTVGDL